MNRSRKCKLATLDIDLAISVEYLKLEVLNIRHPSFSFEDILSYLSHDTTRAEEKEKYDGRRCKHRPTGQEKKVKANFGVRVKAVLT